MSDLAIATTDAARTLHDLPPDSPGDEDRMLALLAGRAGPPAGARDAEALAQFLRSGEAAALEEALAEATAGDEKTAAERRSWFAALAAALGELLDARVAEIDSASGAIGEEAKPSDLIKLNEVLSRFGFQSGLAKACIDAGGGALNTLSRPA
jgi:hypothetical protein